MTTRKFIEAPHGNPWRTLAFAGLAVLAMGCENTNSDTPDGGVGGTGSGGAITGGAGGSAGGTGGGIVGGSNGGSGGALPGGSGGAIPGGSGGEIVGGSGGAIAGGSGGAITGGSGGAITGGSGGEIVGGSGGAIAGGAGGTGVGGAEPPPPAFCGGFAGIPCERGFDCVDDPNDDCDPANGGADCGGICVPNGCPDADADGICDGADGECNSDGSFLMCRRVAPPCAAGTVPEVRNGCYTDACLTWEQCGGAVVEPPVACAPVLPGEFGDCEAVLGVGVGLDGTCQVVSGCGCDAACDGRVFATLDECEAACVVAPPPCGREPAVSPRDPMYDRYEGAGFPNACRADADCFTGGCSGEVCSATADVATTCELVPPAPGACGCVAGECQWYVDVCAPPACRSDADNDGICDDVDGECNLDGMQSVCDRIPPACRAGTVPAVLNGCYTGECVGWDACAPAPPPVGQACGGFAGRPCPRGEACVDVPNDGCDPANGGADCPGMCAAPL